MGSAGQCCWAAVRFSTSAVADWPASYDEGSTGLEEVLGLKRL